MEAQIEKQRAATGRFAPAGDAPISETERKRRHRIANQEVRIILRKEVAERFRAFRETLGAGNSTEVLALLLDKAGAP